ncbi:MAG TPA: EF-hand domain-containing protein [Gemmataceae bacterium]|jgi:Ca2+-binding EF-hand superfamily protein
MRVLIASVALAAILAVGLAVAQDREQRPPPAKEKEKAPGKPLQFDIDRFFKDFDKNGDGVLQRDELPPELRHSFGRIDANQDGKISREELTRGIGHLHPRRHASDVIYMLIEMSDADADSAGEVQRAYDILRKLDKNRDGKIDPDELKAERSRLLRSRVETLFKQLDADNDGRISRAEAKGQILKDFDEIDANRDGYIEREELMRAAAKHPAAPAGRDGEQRPAPDKRPLPPDRRDER